MRILLPPEPWLYLGCLAAIAFADHRTRRIPNKLLLLMLVLRVACLAAAFCIGSPDAGEALVAAVLALLFTAAACVLCLPLFRAQIGIGDGKLLLTLAFCYGPGMFFVGLLCSMAVLAALLLWQKLRGKGAARIPFAPVALLGMLAASIGLLF